MSLTTTEEAQTRALIAQNAALLSLAASEPTIISKLAATKVSLADLTAATSLNDTDLLLVRQGTTEKSVTKSVLSKLANSSVTYAKIQNVTAGKLLGRDTSGSGVVQELPISVDDDGSVTLSSLTSTGGLNVAGSGGFYNSANKFGIDNTGGLTRLYSSGPDGTTRGSFEFHITDSLGALDTVTAQILPSGDFKFTSGFGSCATAYGCRAWVNFNGTGTVVIRGSGNVSSITDVGGVGQYEVNLMTAMPDINYVAIPMVNRPNAESIVSVDGQTTIKVSVNVHGSVNINSGYDASVVGVAIFR
ncbi:hypothetical protein UFOVP1309_46 [uncultured Caudovirales phage]|uniref:Uncharacterized protein n=1 Tax=uncultured Caudovirales phage TaxID=2100421 RepID=A0A6J5RPQ0_9CAUD|nr:hypothetical protein UFOVP1309_46 [uncultured Caudovirales phage]